MGLSIRKKYRGTKSGGIVRYYDKCYTKDGPGMYFSEIQKFSMEDSIISAESMEELSTKPEKTNNTGRCTANQVNVRVEPATNAKSIGKLSKGDVLTILETSNEWSKVRCSFGEGYIKTQYIEPENRHHFRLYTWP